MKTEREFKQVIDLIYEIIHPSKMTLRESLDFMEHLQSHIEGMLDGIRDDIINGEENDL